GEHPINDATEVQRAMKSLHVQAAQLPKIAIDLEMIAAFLAEAQRAAGGRIANLEGHLQHLDDDIGKARAFEGSHNLSAAEHSDFDALIERLKEVAIRATKDAVGEIESIRTGYSDKLQASLTSLRTDGYEPEAIGALDAPGTPSRAEPEGNRHQNQTEAFTKVFGRPPASAADWETAAAVDPHSYDPKNGGARPNIAVQRITPVPGQGVVRTNIFIPGHGVVNPQL